MVQQTCSTDAEQTATVEILYVRGSHSRSADALDEEHPDFELTRDLGCFASETFDRREDLDVSEALDRGYVTVAEPTEIPVDGLEDADDRETYVAETVFKNCQGGQEWRPLGPLTEPLYVGGELRSMRTGDVVVVDDVVMMCDSFGFTRLGTREGLLEDDEPELVTDGGRVAVDPDSEEALQRFAALISGKLGLDASADASTGAGFARITALQSTVTAQLDRLEAEGFNVEAYPDHEPPELLVYPRPGDLETLAGEGPVVLDVELPEGFASNAATVLVHRESTPDKGVSDFVFCTLEGESGVLAGMDVDGWSANEWLESQVMRYYDEVAPKALDSIPSVGEVEADEDLDAIAVGRLFWSDGGDVVALELESDAVDEYAPVTADPEVKTIVRALGIDVKHDNAAALREDAEDLLERIDEFESE